MSLLQKARALEEGLQKETLKDVGFIRIRESKEPKGHPSARKYLSSDLKWVDTLRESWWWELMSHMYQ